MKRTAPLTLTAFLVAAAAVAEVSVDHPTSGGATLYFEPAASGPWGVVRTGLPAPDVLNSSGDAVGDSWPIVYTNGTGNVPEAVWSNGGSDPEIRWSKYDGTAWTSPTNLSRSPGQDNLPALSAETNGNRFIAWNQSRSNSTAVYITALAGNDDGQTTIVELSSRRNRARRPALSAHDDLNVYVAYEEQPRGSANETQIAIDRVEYDRSSGGYVLYGGETSPDYARMKVCSTGLTDPSQPAEVQVHSEGGHLWVDWFHDGDELGWVELLGTAFSDVHYEPYVDGSEDAARAAIRDQVFAP